MKNDSTAGRAALSGRIPDRFRKSDAIDHPPTGEGEVDPRHHARQQETGCGQAASDDESWQPAGPEP